MLRQSGKIILRSLGALLLALVTFAVTLASFLLFTPEFHLTKPQFDWVIGETQAHGLWPKDLVVGLSDFDLRLQRPGAAFSRALLQKRVTVKIRGLVVDYAKTALRVRFDDIELGATGGWRKGEPPANGTAESPWGLIDIEPVVMRQGDVEVDVPAFPEAAPKKKAKSDFDPLQFALTEILPHWRFEHSEIDIRTFSLHLAPKLDYAGRLALTTLDDGQLRLEVDRFRDLHGPLSVSLFVRLIPREAPAARGWAGTAWKLFLSSQAQLAARKTMGLTGQAEITPFSAQGTGREPAVDFSLASEFKGIIGVQRASLAGHYQDARLSGRVSVKVGALGAQLRALDLLGCQVSLDLTAKTGGVACGPETVRLQLVEKDAFRDPGLYILAPQLDLKLSRLSFSDTKSADAQLHLQLEHGGMLSVVSDATARFVSAPKEPVRYQADGTASVRVDRFGKIVSLTKETAFSVPAPLNSLDGKIAANLSLHVDQDQAQAIFSATTRLDSSVQAVHLDLDARADLVKIADRWLPKIRGALGIEALKISAPRIDLRVPPRLYPDARFGPLREVASAKTAAGPQPPAPLIVAGSETDRVLRTPKKKPGAPMDFLFRVRTIKPQAIQIATSLTKSPIPIDLDLLYDGRKALPPPPSPELARSPALSPELPSVARSGSESGSSTSHQDLFVPPAKAKTASPVTGSITIGHTPIEILRRNAVLRELRLDLLSSGDNRITGDVNVSYLEYSIDILVSGLLNNPQVRFTSDPPLDDNQILAVLLFGRPLDELQEDQKDSVGNLNAAFADAALGMSSLYLLASTPIESIGYDPDSSLVMAHVGLGGGTTLEVGGGAGDASAVGFKKRLSHNLTLRSDVESIGASGQKTVSALLEWIRRF